MAFVKAERAGLDAVEGTGAAGSGQGVINLVVDRAKRVRWLEDFRISSVRRKKTLDRTLQFWTRCTAIYVSYKVCQLRVRFVKDSERQEKIWEDQHEKAAEKIYALCSEMGGFFLKSAQILGKPDLAPMAWVKKLVDLCDRAPETPYPMVQRVIQTEFGKHMDELFERFDEKPIGSASIAQVHKARVKGAAKDVAVKVRCLKLQTDESLQSIKMCIARKLLVCFFGGDLASKVQHPGIEELMMTDIRNQKAFAAFLQRFDVKFDLLSVVDELEKQVQYEFDFVREAKSMDQIAVSLANANHGNPPVLIPRSVKGMVTRRVLVMDFIEGIQILRLRDEMTKRGLNPQGARAMLAKRNILRNLSTAYGQMILKDGFFQADPHPGNILVNKYGKVALLDYGQVKELGEELKLHYASLVVGLASRDVSNIKQAFHNLGIEIQKKDSSDPGSFETLAVLMFDTELPPGITKVTPFGEDTILKKLSVRNFPKDLFFVLRTVHLLRGLSVAMGINYSACKEWEPLAREVLARRTDCEATPKNIHATKVPAWERRQRSKRRSRRLHRTLN